MRRAAPLRFLALVVGGWILVRAAILTPGWWNPNESPGTVTEALGTPATTAPARYPTMANRRSRPGPIIFQVFGPPSRSPAAGRPTSGPALSADTLSSAAAGPLPRARLLRDPPDPFIPGRRDALAVPPIMRSPSRWAGSAWLLLRDDSGRPALAPGGTLGGSQAGARLLYRIGGGLALSGRAYAPLRRIAGAEVAAGIDWQPRARLPVHLLAERRQRLGREGRSAFALTLYGGVSGRLPAGLRGEAYAQAGIVGLRSRDLFVDGSVRLGLPVGPVEIGGGAWGAAQPGAARLDAGPSLSYRLPVSRANLRLRADWRFRIAGDATPGSGPALTLAADF